MWRREREHDGGLPAVIQFLRMTGTENVLPVCRRRGSRRGALRSLMSTVPPTTRSSQNKYTCIISWNSAVA